ncbi:JAB domain-containing protein [Clostridium botulinum]|uniref:RadC family protein n=1 Tax=Clostridium botulinum TaxID=1491 RepID=UPI0001F8497D|nr:DNA repair protein RadC [Clostridium botulinum]NFB16948.1 JAB domain-containing protein [Clostridium botulinum]NFB67746.1 JAB domain-containing protein [Clostridium botulinum]NFB97248.1 JAB domain-containing protein [Clostridium botulinum]NFC46868.1 JAB domain-containing protein [Clostridium botulinum]NFC58184.1 JAB domain-containing protein [Clostridium botulinum]
MDNNFKIKDLPKNERPQERLIRYGAEVLSNSELLAVILRTGTKNQNIMMLASSLIKETGGLDQLFNQSIEELTKIKGIGVTKAVQILALSELSKRFKTYKSGNEYKINTPLDVSNLVMEDMKYLKQEKLKILILNTKNIVTYTRDVFIGTLNSSIVHPREIFCEAIKKNGASIIICHNHPSGDPTPSKEDINITLRLKECGKLIGIDLLDHIIIGENKYVSMKEKGTI